jgi:hypothetical protein
MKIERIKIKNLEKDFEEKFDKKDNIICVLDNEPYHGSIYRNNFLYNILNIFKIDKRERRGDGTLTECDVSVLVNDKYTIRVECTKEESFENDKKGYIATLKRSYFADEKTYDKNKRRHGFRNEPYLEDLLGYDLNKESVVFDNYFYKGFTEYLYEYLLCINCWTKEVVENISDYAKQNFPMTLANGDKIYINIPKEVDEEWVFQLIGVNGNEYNDENEAYVNLIEFIIANSIIKDICRKRDDEDYPLYICDAFNKLSKEQTKTVMNLIKEMDNQVFVILRVPNELVSDYADKTIVYHYIPNEKIDDLPF